MTALALEPQWEVFRWNITHFLTALHDVRWDRLIQNEDHLRIYGWVDEQPGGRADFVLLSCEFHPPTEGEPEPHMSSDFITSSASYGRTMFERLNEDPDGHVDCQRVEHHFAGLVTNVIKLSGEQP